jgi:hypothetical protein
MSLFHVLAPAIPNKVTIKYLQSQKVQLLLAFQKLKIIVYNHVTHRHFPKHAVLTFLVHYQCEVSGNAISVTSHLYYR